MSESGDSSRGEALIEIGRYDDAVEVLQSAVAAKPDDTRAWCLLANAFLRAHSYGEAVDAARIAVATDARNEWGYRLFASARLAQARQTWRHRRRMRREARGAARTAVQLGPGMMHGHMILAECELALGRVRVARAEARRAVELAPARAEPHVTAGLVELHAHRWRNAEREARRALELDPTCYAATNNLGVALRNRRRLTSGLTHGLSLYAASARLDPSRPVARTNFVRTGRFVLWRGLVAIALPPCILAPWTLWPAFIATVVACSVPSRRVDRWATTIALRLVESPRRWIAYRVVAVATLVAGVVLFLDRLVTMGVLVLLVALAAMYSVLRPTPSSRESR